MREFLFKMLFPREYLEAARLRETLQWYMFVIPIEELISLRQTADMIQKFAEDKKDLH